MRPMEQLALATRAAFRGIGYFYTHPYCWIYALIPLVLLLLAGAGLFYGIIEFNAFVFNGILEPLRGMLPDHGVVDFFVTLIKWTFYITVPLVILLFAVSLVPMVYEGLGSFFFDRMVRRIEREEYGIERPEIPFGMELKLALESLGYALLTVGFSLLIYIPSLLIPVVGPLLYILIFPRLAMSYLFPASFGNGLRIHELKKRCEGRSLTLYIFGFWIYFLSMIASVFVLPGLIVAGVFLFHDDKPPLQPAP